MTEPLNRNEIIALLERLGGGDDAEVLDAARALHAAIAHAGMNWDDLLVPEDAGDGGHTDTEVDEPANAGAAADTGDAGAAADAGDGEAAEAPMPASATKRDTEALALIKKLMARPGITDSFREEMEGYKADIAEGVFADADHKYLRALAKRLSGKG